MNNTPKDIEKLEKEINRIENKYYNKNNNELSDTSSSRKGLMIVIEFVSAIFAGGAIGYFLDILFDTKPIFLISLLLFGISAGFLNIYRFTRSLDEEV